MTESPPHGHGPDREGSNEQATRGARPGFSPRPEERDDAGGAGEPTGAPAAASSGTSPWFIAPERLDVIDSTNRYLADLAKRGAPEGSSVIAGQQTAGRGRLGREWLDVPGGSLLCSMLFRPAMKMDQWHLVSILVALAGLDACADAAGVEAVCKWPNDLVVEGRKVGGILAEVVSPPASAPVGVGTSLVVGIGLNCNWAEAWDSAPLGHSALATSLDRVAGRPVDMEAVASRLLERVAQRYSVLTGGTRLRPPGAGAPAPTSGARLRRPATATAGAPAPTAGGSSPSAGAGAAPPASAPERSLVSEYRRKLDTLGRVVRVELVDEVFTGRALDVDDAGHLLVDVGMCMRTVEAGDVVHLR